MITRPIKSERSLRRYTQQGSAWRIEAHMHAGDLGFGSPAEWVKIDKHSAYRILRGLFMQAGKGAYELRAVREVGQVTAITDEPAQPQEDTAIEQRRFTLTWGDGVESHSFGEGTFEDALGYIHGEDVDAVAALPLNGKHTDRDGDIWTRVK